MCIGIMILTIEEKTAASLRIKVPKQNTKTAFSEEAGEVDGCSGLTDATFDIIYGDLFQELKLITKSVLQ
jgi:hypothetical protein